ncbi:MAG: hypothetical protein ABJQ23_03575 [Shimia thalassica]|uniref:Flp family type IVb pilin n=1 Tax=Shimia thalassica TaxID=1715693 RepID=UPI00329A3E87
MKHFLARFHRNETGAVTVDWVVICAGIVALGIAAMTVIEGGTVGLANDTGSAIQERLND